MTDRTCGWAVANPDKALGGTSCWGWSGCRRGECERKRQAAQKRKAEQASYRKFPGSTYQQARAAARLTAIDAFGTPDGKLTSDQWAVVRGACSIPRGHCTWCGGQIRDPRNPSALALNRTWHGGKMAGEPDCLGDYFAHTRMDYQKRLLIERDGPMCASCGERRGSDVDHRLALGLVVLLILEPHRWRYWGPANLQLLCHPCHVQKTRADVVAIKALRTRLAGGVAQRALPL